MNPLFAQLAIDWIEAERKANPTEWPVSGRPTKDEMSVAVDRIYQVMSGEVKWSEASPGDKAVWKSRVENIAMFERSWRKDGTSIKRKPGDGVASEMDELMGLARPPDGETIDPYNQVAPRPPARRGQTGGPRLEGVRERLWWNFYDTLPGIDHTTPQTERLFGVAMGPRIGRIFLTNMYQAGQLPGDQTFIILGLYISISSLEALHWAADRVGVTFVIGDRPQLPFLFVRDLFRGVPLVTPKARPLIIPVRQSFGATVDFKEKPPQGMDPFDLTLHIEGLQTRDVY